MEIERCIILLYAKKFIHVNKKEMQYIVQYKNKFNRILQLECLL